GLTDLELDTADALLAGDIGVPQQLFERRVQEAARGVVTTHRGAMAAEQTRQGKAAATRLEIPQGNIESADGLGRQPAAADRGASPAQLVPESGDIAGVLADQVRCHFQSMGELTWTARALGIAETQAAVAIARLDLGNQDGDLGHRLLPAGQHLSIADRVGQRQGYRTQAQPGNAIVIGAWGGVISHDFFLVMNSAPCGPPKMDNPSQIKMIAQSFKHRNDL